MGEGQFPDWRKRLQSEYEAQQKAQMSGKLGREIKYCEPCNQADHDLFKVPPGWSGIYAIAGPVVSICPCCTTNHPKVEVQE